VQPFFSHISLHALVQASPCLQHPSPFPANAKAVDSVTAVKNNTNFFINYNFSRSGIV
jgi:hypothetical protein